MTEQSHDYSDHPMSVDQKMIATLVELDVVTENYIRHEMGDEEYESYLAHEQTERKLNKIIKEQGIATTTPNEVMKQRAAEIARELVEPGEGISASVDQRAGEVALNEWKDTIRKGENSLYLQVYGEVSDQIEQVVDQDIAIEYPGMHLTRAHEGILSFSDDIAMGGPQLQIIISIDGMSLKVEARYAMVPRNIGEPFIYTDIDLSSGEIQDINISRFKSDVLMALQHAVLRVSELPQEEE